MATKNNKTKFNEIEDTTSFFAEIETPCTSFDCFDYAFPREKSANDILQHCIVVSDEIC